ncbi:hypothetical protein EJ08DRAFT_400025 [Tothia fuscella]|uniref:Uncharacterized protein n=1 Tax=Tothia fuscella TaxID=1048955 RepID=A0A9P4NKB4_9PEZI|nr:hypothetical protein EJ08DRAFT_400025 [Tothia fuscella]
MLPILLLLWRRVTGHVQFILNHFENLALLTITLVQDRTPHESDLVALLGKSTSPDTIKAFVKANYAAEFQVSQCVELNLARRWATARRDELLKDTVRLLNKECCISYSVALISFWWAARSMHSRIELLHDAQSSLPITRFDCTRHQNHSKLQNLSLPLP